ncbi:MULTISPECIES: response regulator transcription factor [unclassified Herbaspirillum]|uniref:response regulator transcription factor n=1 Tax=unclassified Herbaspirillum TaxID=2624150 RepID=UPI0011544372|nr:MULTISPECIES: response regulator transcription factor [unclassified Herbaspirillum]MBB5391323.1 DNA-binding response OmpR family regulator [Herbaspirillum sp. SJZ102]TQK12990.1 DNA-binding response OmpR family regulator [Herbaspirillum sp. SJZ130]TQK14994.1 DNA-binding response OmpR family regulator [Herbaspirillum sp. SJZ106]TWC67350.1 DNA-binding response OmpR family regulator [Herbaspirillum sp. SJZ099]
MNIACYIRNSNIYDQVKNALVRVGYLPTQFDSETTLLRTLKRKTFEFVIIDLSSAESEDSIFSWLSLRSGDPIPTLILSSGRSADMVAQALDNGADDFLQRPFEAVELVARINAVMRRCAPKNNRRVIEYAGFQLQRDAAKLSYLGSPISLTPREFSMAWLFFSSPGVYISRETLGSVIWSTDSEIAGRTIEQHVYKLRKKLQIDNRNIVVIRTAYSQGYRLDPVDTGQDQTIPSPSYREA